MSSSPSLRLSLFILTGPEYIMDASSTVCYATYGKLLNPFFLDSIFFAALFF